MTTGRRMMASSSRPSRRRSPPALSRLIFLLLGAILLLTSTKNAAAKMDLFKGSNPPTPTALVDASTGTVTAVDPTTQDKAASTCDDIMARSVVLANEDKAAAITERDEALASARAAADRVSELEAELRHLNDELTVTRAVAIKAKDDTKAAVDEAKREAYGIVNRTKAEADELIEKVLKDATDDIAAAIADAERKTADAQALVEKKEREAQDEIASARLDAERLVADAETHAEKARSEAQDEIAAVKEEAQQLKADTDALLRRVREETDANIAAAREEARTSISIIRTESERKMESISSELRAEQEKTKSECQATASDLESTIGQLQREKEEQIAKKEADHWKAVDQLIKETDDAARSLEAKLMKEKQAVERSLEAKEDEYDRLVEDTGKAMRESMEKIQRFERREKKFKNLVEKLKGNVTTLETEMNQTYCNMTNIQRDIVHSVKLTGETLNELCNYLYQTAAIVIRKAAAPIVEKTMAIYNRHVKEAVDTHLMPVYKLKIVPIHEEHVIPAKKTASVVIEDGWEFAVEAAAKGWELSVKFMKKIALTLYSHIVKSYEWGLDCSLGFLEKHDKDKIVTQGFRENMKLMRLNADKIVTLQLKTLAALLFFVNIPFLFDIFFLLLELCTSLLTEVMFLPFRFCRFFCPLRFFFRKRAGMNDTVAIEGRKDGGDDIKVEEDPTPELVDETESVGKPENGTNAS